MHPFSTEPLASVAPYGEVGLLAEISDWIRSVSPAAPAGFGDDAAVVAVLGQSVLVTVDGVLWGRHFDDSAPPEAVGRKLVHRNLSDLAAMGGHPLAGVLALTFGGNLSLAWLERFYAGLVAACQSVGLSLVGGDLAEGNDSTFAAHLTLLGTPPARPLARLGSQTGDHLFVTGHLGGSLLGHHLNFSARLAEGAWLASHPQVHCAIDVTDGLAKDLPALLGGDQLAWLDLDQIPVSEAAQRFAPQSGKTALHHALCDGEDYELLFSLDRSADPQAFERQFSAAFPQTPLARLGSIETLATVARQSGVLDPLEVTAGTAAATVKWESHGESPRRKRSGALLWDASTGRPLDVQGGFQHWQQPDCGWD